YNPRWAERNPTKYAIMSAAGPMANFFLAFVAFVLIWILMGADLLTFGGTSIDEIVLSSDGKLDTPMAMFAQALSILLALNVLLGMFNLMPLPPLDGASVIEGLWPKSAGAFYQRMR